MLRDTQIKHNHGKPTKTAADFKIKEWILKNFKIDWFGNECPQKDCGGFYKPCWNCVGWNGLIKKYKEGKLK